ncbi:hypothetical protein SAZ10_03110 [Mesorhizobium sp. BAC0120]|uniref:hypothetical protein n=1 Tax=Mesorhizobium sp. BAC0120 TaxID=3090670 RepID=UPI00298D47C4|nr:hypothetical protein [Mesorhizobium sp. BAC0120]MDW6020745.1 hypothetical protein [Mesorhizobium sp. BAC0120]
MQKFRTLILAGVAIAAIAGTAAAEPAKTHVLTVRLPDGSLEKIRYTGDQPPAVDIAPAAGDAIFLPAFDDFWSPFADLERMSAVFDRMTYGNPDRPFELDGLPPGVQGYTMVSTLSGHGLCTRTTRYFSVGNGRPPRVETKTSGNCAAAPVAKREVRTVKPKHQHRTDSNSDLIQVSYKQGDAKVAKLNEN